MSSSRLGQNEFLRSKESFDQIPIPSRPDFLVEDQNLDGWHRKIGQFVGDTSSPTRPDFLVEANPASSPDFNVGSNYDKDGMWCFKDLQETPALALPKCRSCCFSRPCQRQICEELDQMMNQHHERMETMFSKMLDDMRAGKTSNSNVLGEGLHQLLKAQGSKLERQRSPNGSGRPSQKLAKGESVLAESADSETVYSSHCWDRDNEMHIETAECMQERQMTEARNVSTTEHHIADAARKILAQKESWREPITKLAQHLHFQLIGALFIFANAIWIGVEVDHVAKYGQAPEWFGMLNLSFTALFLIEWILRVIGEGKDFLKTSLGMNLLDTFVVFCSVAEAISDILRRINNAGGGADGLRAVTAVRIARILRLLRLVRVLRIPRILRFVSALRTLVMSIILTLKELFWSVVLLGLLIYVAAIIFCQAATEYAGDAEIVDLDRFWGDMATAMLTLFMIISNGVSWIEPVSCLGELSVGWVILMVVYVFFTYFAVLNVITGIFCNSAIETCSHDPDLVAQSLKSSKTKYVEKVRQLFMSVDADGSGNITLHELEDLLNGNQDMQAYFEAMGLHTDDAWTLFRLMDHDGGHTIDIDEFVSGVMKLKGSAKSVDLAKLTEDSKELRNALAIAVKQMQASISEVSEQQLLLLKVISAAFGV